MTESIFQALAHLVIQASVVVKPFLACAVDLVKVQMHLKIFAVELVNYLLFDILHLHVQLVTIVVKASVCLSTHLVQFLFCFAPDLLNPTLELLLKALLSLS